jgi:putative transposase
MKEVLLAVLASVRAGLRSRAALQLEVLALRHQLAVYQRRNVRAHTKVADRLLWAWLSRAWTGWRDVLVFVQPSTVIAWQQGLELGEAVVEIAEAGGLYRHYERRAA